jgi:hypothetical protein
MESQDAGVVTMPELVVVKLKPAVYFREFPFGIGTDPSMREFMAEGPWTNQDKILEYLRSGHVLALTMGADLTDWFDRPHKANPVINGQAEGGTTPLSDGEWFWYASVIHFVERYNVRLSEEFTQHAAKQQWRVSDELDKNCRYVWSYC